MRRPPLLITGAHKVHLRAREGLDDGGEIHYLMIESNQAITKAEAEELARLALHDRIVKTIAYQMDLPVYPMVTTE